MMAEVQVYGHGPRRYYFRGTAGDSYMGDIAIDDVSFRRCEMTKLCSDDQFTCDVPDCVEMDEVCYTIDKYSLYRIYLRNTAC